MKNLMTCFVALALLPLVPIAAAGAEPAAPEAFAPIDISALGLEKLLDERLQTAGTGSTTKCTALKTCATAIAVSDVVCQRPAWRTASCVGGSAVGGHGVSGLGLPGSVSWYGRSTCYRDCSDTKVASGYHAWPGGGFDGKGGGKTLDHPVRTKFNALRQECVNYGVESSTSARASVSIGTAIDSIPAADKGRAEKGLCTF